MLMSSDNKGNDKATPLSSPSACTHGKGDADASGSSGGKENVVKVIREVSRSANCLMLMKSNYLMLMKSNYTERGLIMKIKV